MVVCLGQSADLHMAQLMPLPLTVSCPSQSRLFYLPGFTFLVPAHPGRPGHSPGDRKTVVVIVVVAEGLPWTISLSRLVLIARRARTQTYRQTE